MKQELIDRLKQTAHDAIQDAEAEHGEICWHLEWSDRMTFCAGKAFCRSNTIRLSLPIFTQAIADGGIGYACEQVKETVLHELAHLYAPGVQSHGREWRRQMERLGAKPDRTHSMRTQQHVDQNIDPYAVIDKSDFPIGSKIEFEHDGQTIFGTIIRHNKKTFSVMVDSHRWRIYWRWAAENVIVL